jgi:uncharacterized protein (TIGR02001 family)
MRLGGHYRLAAGLLAAPVVTLLAAGPAFAQLTSSLSADSDYLYRGVNLSGGRPVVRLDLAYDHPSGAYGGVSLIGMRDSAYGDIGPKSIGLSSIGYAGYVWQPAQGPSWEAGVSDTHIRNGGDHDYNEVYGGVITRAFTARLYYAPHYYGSRTRTLYSELSTARRLTASWRAFLHAGMLTPLDGAYRRERYDVRAGLAVSLSHYEIQAAWSRTNPVAGYPMHRPADGNALVLSASCFF